MKSKLLYERALITCVLMLIVSIILKLFGVPWFDLDTNVPMLDEINDIVMNNNVLSFVYSFIFLCLNTTLVVSIVSSKYVKRKIPFVLYIGVFTFLNLIMDFYCNDSLKFIKDTFIFFLCCYIRYGKISLSLPIQAMFLSIIYQIISSLLRVNTVSIGSYGLVTSILLSIDYYILLIMTYLYVRKEDITCGIIRVYGSFLAKKLCRKPTQNSNQCSSKES